MKNFFTNIQIFLPRGPVLATPGALSVHLQTVSRDPEIGAGTRDHTLVERAVLELGDEAARLADKVVMVALGHLIAGPIAEVHPAHQP